MRPVRFFAPYPKGVPDTGSRTVSGRPHLTPNKRGEPVRKDRLPYFLRIPPIGRSYSATTSPNSVTDVQSVIRTVT